MKSNNNIGDDAFEDEAPERRGALTLSHELSKEIDRCQAILKDHRGFALFKLRGAIEWAETTIRSGNAIDMRPALENIRAVHSELAGGAQ
ncbi:hypothetical protein [Paludisphaera rhizosphaerae]|nr:hypothetical protein [Paludisphaera rhizosphaerae]